MIRRILLIFLLVFCVSAAFSQTRIITAVINNDTTALLTILKKEKDSIDVKYSGFTPLNFAARDGFTEIARILLDNGAKINEPGNTDDGLFTPLMLAVRNNQAGVIQLLLERGADRTFVSKEGTSVATILEKLKPFWGEFMLRDLKAASIRYQAYQLVLTGDSEGCKKLIEEYGIKAADGFDSGWGILHYAVRNGDLDFVIYLVKKGCDINQRNGYGSTPLVIATINNLAKICDYLVRAGTDITIKDNEGRNAMAWTKILGSDNLAEILVDPDRGMQTYQKDLKLFTAIENKSRLQVQAALDNGANLEALGTFHQTPLAAAINKNYVNIGKLLLQQGANPNREFGHPDHRNVPLLWSVGYGWVEYTYLLLKYGADTAKTVNGGKKAIEKARESKFFWVEQVLLDTNRYHNWAIQSWIETGEPVDTAYMKVHLKKGINLDFRDAAGNTLLHIAAKKQNVAWMHYLLKLGADKSILNDDKETAADLLYSNYAKLFFTDIQKAERYRQFFDAVIRDDTELVKKLLAAGTIDVNMKNQDGFTALQLAVHELADESVALLLKNGADPNLRSLSDITPLKVAAISNNYPAMLLLLEAKAKLDPDDIKDTKSYWITKYAEDPAAASADYKAHLSLWNAAAKGDTSILTPAFIKNTDINLPNAAGYTALHFAAAEGKTDFVKVLIRYGANLNLQTTVQQKTPLMLAGAGKHTDVIRELLYAGADYDKIKDSDGLVFEDISDEDPALSGMVSKFQDITIEKLVAKLLFQSVERTELDNFKLYERYLRDVNITDSLGQTLLYKSVYWQKNEIIDWLLAKGADVNRKSLDKQLTPLMAAAENGDLPVTKKLLEKGADARALNADGLTASRIAAANNYPLLSRFLDGDERAGVTLEMILAVKEKDTLTARKFLEKGADPNGRLRDSTSFTALHFAARGNQFGIIPSLLKAGAAVNAKAIAGDEYFTPIMLAAYNDNFRISDLLIQNGADAKWTNEKDSSAVTIAKKKSKYVAMLFDNPKKAREKYNREKRLIDVIREYDYFEAKRLLDSGSNPNITDATGYTPLHYAVSQRSEETTSKLLAKGAIVDAVQGDYTPLMLAVRNNDFDMISMLMDNKATATIKNKTDSSAVDLAAARHYDAIVELLKGNKYVRDLQAGVNAIVKDSIEVFNDKLRGGMDVNMRGQFGYTLLHYAAREDRLEMVKKLLALGANVDIQGADGYTPLMIAARNNRWKIAYLLLINNAQKDLKNTDGETAKSISTIYGNRIITEMIAQPDSVYNNMMMVDAVKNGKIDELRELLRKRIDVNFKDEIDWSALDYAARDNKLEMVEILLRNGADPDYVAKTTSGQYSPLMLAAYNDNSEIMKLLLDYGAKVDTVLDGRTALQIAVNEKMYWPEVLLRNRVEGYQRFLLSTRLQQAIKNDDLPSVKEALLLGASLKEPVIKGKKALYYAVYNEAKKTLAYLARITEQIDEETEDEYRYTPLTAAVNNDDLESAFQLVSYGANINYKTKTGLSAQGIADKRNFPLMLNLLRRPAEFNRQFNLLKLIDEHDVSAVQNIIKDGAPLNIDLGGDYPLTRAAQRKLPDIVALLLKSGAKADIKDSLGKTAIDYAMTISADDLSKFTSNIVTKNSRQADPNAQQIINRKFETGAFHAFLLLAKAGGIPNVTGSKPLDWYEKNFKDPDAADKLARNEKLAAAIAAEDLQAAGKAIAEGADPNFYDARGFSLLGYAIAMHQDSIAMLLLDKGAVPGTIRPSLPMELAVLNADTIVVGKMIEKGFKINEIGTNGKTVLEYAIEDASQDMLLYLIRNGADPNMPDADGRKPIYMALNKNTYLAVTEALLKAGADPDDTPVGDDLYPLCLASFREIAQIMVDNKTNVNQRDKYGWAAIHHAAKNNRVGALTVLIAANANVDYAANAEGKQYTPLMLAIYNDNIEIALMLQKAGANLFYKDSVGTSAYTIARDAKNDRMIRFLLDPQQARLDFMLRTAVTDLELDSARAYFARGANINVQDIKGNTPLHKLIAAYSGSEKAAAMLDLLIQQKASLHIMNKEGDTPLDIAIKSNLNDVVEKMLSAGVNPNQQNNDKRRPLELAVQEGEARIAWSLLKAGADKNQKTIMGETVTDIARKKANHLMLDVLDNKTDPNKVRLFSEWQQAADTLRLTDSTYNVWLYNIRNGIDAARNEGKTNISEYYDMYENYVYALAYNNYFSEALAASEELTAMLKEKGDNDERYRRSFLLQEALFKSTGNTKKAIEIVKTAINLMPNQSIEKMKAYERLARLYDDSLATEYYRLALAQVPGNIVTRDILEVRIGYAADFISRKDSTGVNMLYQIENTILTTNIGTDHLATIYGHIISYEHERNRSERAQAYLDKLIALPDNPENWIDIGIKSALLKRYDKAEFYFKKGQQRMISSTKAQYHLLRIYLESNQQDKAVAAATSLSASLINEINQDFKFLSEEEKYNLLKQRESYFEMLYSAAVQYPNSKELTSIITNNILFTKGALIRNTAGLNLVLRETTDPVVNELYKKWKQTKGELESQYALNAADRRLDIEFLEEKLREYEKKLYRYSDVRDSTVNWQKVRAGLLPGEAVLEFVTFEQYRNKWTDSVKIIALLITPDRATPQLVPLCYESQLFAAVKKSETEADASYVNRLYVSRGNEKLGKANTESKSVYNLIWKPLEKTLIGKKQLYLSLSGSLHKLSFAALPFGKDSLLLDKFDIKYINSAANLAEDRKKNTSITKSITLFGGIDYEDTEVTELPVKQDTVISSRSLSLDASRGGSWKYLPGTLSETEQISKLFKANGWDAKLYVAKDATEKRLKGLTGNAPAIIHIATHGYFFPEPKQELQSAGNVFIAAQNPLMRTGLLLAGGNTSWQKGYTRSGTDDGILTAYEVSNLNLNKTDLVVLSACETGLGDIRGSEGVYGLQRAFKIAGANKLIMSLWQVPDKETAELMQYFYSYLITEKDYHKAFNLAQKKMRQKYPPYFWAAFILVE